MTTPSPLGVEQIHAPDLLIWADCEFTGLPIEHGHKITEIGALVTTLGLQEIDSYHSFVAYDWAHVESLMDINPWWNERTDDRDRMRAGIQAGSSPAVIDQALADLTEHYFGDHRPPLCGNSIHSDKKHIDVEFPIFASKLSYQVIDITSLKLVAQKYKNVSYDAKAHKHFAIDDIRESVDELRFLLTALGIAELPL